jgi:hypothetical protein
MDLAISKMQPIRNAGLKWTVHIALTIFVIWGKFMLIVYLLTLTCEGQDCLVQVLLQGYGRDGWDTKRLSLCCELVWCRLSVYESHFMDLLPTA